MVRTKLTPLGRKTVVPMKRCNVEIIRCRNAGFSILNPPLCVHVRVDKSYENQRVRMVIGRKVTKITKQRGQYPDYQGWLEGQELWESLKGCTVTTFSKR